MANMFDVRLLRAAKKNLNKMAYVDPATAAGGGMPIDPAMMGAAGGMPVDPAMMNAAGGMPMDPAMMGAAGGMPPPASGGITPEQIRQIVQETIGGTGGKGGGEAKKKVDLGVELYQIKKLLVYLCQAIGVQLPPEILLGESAQAVPSQPEESGASVSTPPSPAPAVTQGAIQPIQPIQPAFNMPAG